MIGRRRKKTVDSRKRIGSLGTSLHSSWIHIKNKDYGIQQYNNSNIGGYQHPCTPPFPVGSPHPVALLQGSSEPRPMARVSRFLDDAIPHTYHPLIPYAMLRIALNDYVPQKYLRRASFETLETDRMLLNFKQGNRLARKWAANLVGNALSLIDMTNTVIVCIPASCERTNNRRFKKFSAEVSEKLGAIDGFQHIEVIGKREKVHRSKTHEQPQQDNVRIDAEWFSNRQVIILDDITTTGKTADAFIKKLENAGAHVRMAIFLAKTKNYHRTSTIKYN